MGFVCMDNHPVVSIDGPAAVGKSTVSRAVARHLGFMFVSSGELYRAVTWTALESGISAESKEMLSKFLFQLRISSKFLFGKAIFLVNGVDCAVHLSDTLVRQYISRFSRVPEFRRVLLEPLRDLGRRLPLVMEGRDIGSVVFPETPYKFYLDASEKERQHRREMQGIIEVIRERDQLDSTREIAPLIVPVGAWLVDTTHLTREEVVQQILRLLKIQGFHFSL
ncbi:Cytidylate kinase [Candidatus Xiphinematobacter sp. Idaho Grape]|nr:Cytidylate kinase [Candidatus Xiphinematobacter sp. Idaho Grape]